MADLEALSPDVIVPRRSAQARISEAALGCSRLDGIVTAARQRDASFVPADARHFCAHCGFPFRRGDWGRLHCHEYDLPDHGRCEKRLRDARDQEGLKMRLRKTQEADPYARRTNEDAIAHDWVRQQYPAVNLKEWQPARAS
jgi:hypothetical protein